MKNGNSRLFLAITLPLILIAIIVFGVIVESIKFNSTTCTLKEIAPNSYILVDKDGFANIIITEEEQEKKISIAFDQVSIVRDDSKVGTAQITTKNENSEQISYVNVIIYVSEQDKEIEAPIKRELHVN